MTSTRYLARVIVTLKPVVNDPQGLTVKAGLHRLGFGGVEEVRVGKFIEMRLRAENEAAARSQVSDMCHRLLANHVIEDVRFQVEGVAPAAAEPSGATSEHVAAG